MSPTLVISSCDFSPSSLCRHQFKNVCNLLVTIFAIFPCFCFIRQYVLAWELNVIHFLILFLWYMTFSYFPLPCQLFMIYLGYLRANRSSIHQLFCVMHFHAQDICNALYPPPCSSVNTVSSTKHSFHYCSFLIALIFKLFINPYKWSSSLLQNVAVF